MIINPIHGVPKSDGSVRPVINNSNPKKQYHLSVNGHIIEPLKTVKYPSLRSIVANIDAEGKGCWVWSRDLEDGYFNCIVKEEQCRFLAFEWADRIWIPTVMVFGLSSAPRIFTQFMLGPLKAIRMEDTSVSYRTKLQSEVDQLIYENEIDVEVEGDMVRYPLIKAYVDDIIGLHKDRAHATQQFINAGRVLKRFQLKAKEKKDQRPSQLPIVLGALINTKKRRVFLTHKKAEKYISDIMSIIKSRKRIHISRLFTIIGRARHAAMFLRMLGVFARNLDTYVHSNWGNTIPVDDNLVRDLEWVVWCLRRAESTGISFDHILKPANANDVTGYTDAATVVGGVGGFLDHSDGTYFQCKWSDISLQNAAKRDIQWRELSAVFLLIKLNVRRLAHKAITAWCDNSPSVWMITKCRAPLKRPDLQEILNQLAKLLIQNEIHLWMEHIPGVKNVTADKLSRYYPNPLEDCRFRDQLRPNPPQKVQRELQRIATQCRALEIQRLQQANKAKLCAPPMSFKRKHRHIHTGKNRRRKIQARR